jgi:DNA-binding transcriptional MocR family regulator
MQKHAAIMGPKFELADKILTSQLAGTGAAAWFIPDGGYFFAVDTLPGCAKKTEVLCKNAGLIITDAGATFPYGKDPQDKNLRIAPSFLSPEELEHALFILCAAIKSAALERVLAAQFPAQANTEHIKGEIHA